MVKRFVTEKYNNILYENLIKTSEHFKKIKLRKNNYVLIIFLFNKLILMSI